MQVTHEVSLLTRNDYGCVTALIWDIIVTGRLKNRTTKNFDQNGIKGSSGLLDEGLEKN